MKRIAFRIAAWLAVALAAQGVASTASAEVKKTFNIAWTIYVGWMPWQYAADGGVDTSAIIVGDFSNGNDGIVLKKGKTLADIKGQRVNIVELSVSHYLLARALATVKLTEKDIKTVNTSDADIVAAFKSADS